MVGGVPEQYVYVYDTVSADWHFYDALGIGSHVDVRVVKASSCEIGDPSCVFIAQLWNHSAGAWETLRSVTLPMDRMYIEEYTEVYQDPSQPPVHMKIDIDSNDLDWFETDRQYADASWHLWSASNTAAGDSSGDYCTNWINNYYRFNTYKGPC